MTQIVAALVQLREKYTGKVIGYTVTKLDGTPFTPFTTQDVTETSIPGTYAVYDGVEAPAEGGYIAWGESGGEMLAGATIPKVAQDVWSEVLAGAYLPPTAGGLLVSIYNRTLEMSGAQSTVCGLPAKANIECHRGDTFKHQFVTYDPAMATRADLRFTVKKKRSDDDSESVIQVNDATGLLVLNGATGTAGDASLTVTELQDGDAQTYWSIDLLIKAAATKELEEVDGLACDLQLKSGDEIITLTDGRFDITADVTHFT